MARDHLPKKILIIKDCTFILPDDFDGTLEDAFNEFLKYREERLEFASKIDDSHLFSTLDILLHSKEDFRACGVYGICEFIDGKYQIANDSCHT